MNHNVFIFGTATLSAMVAATSDTLDSATHIPLGSAFSVLAVVLPACWYFAGKFKSIDGQLDKINEKLKELPCKDGRQMQKKKEETCDE